jgi:hypothetical protein
MSKLAYCGLDCEACQAYIVTQNNDTEGKKKLAEEWSKTYSADIKEENINCDGCTAGTGRVIDNWRDCEIRKCAQETKKVTTCAYCRDYPCGTLSKFIDAVPDAKVNLESISIRSNK